MKAEEFLSEKKVKQYEFESLTAERAHRILSQYCTEARETLNYPLFRGMRNHSDKILTINPSTGERKSQNTSNHYTTLLDNSPYMQGWPKRSRSLICSTSSAYAGHYGKVYAIFPVDGTKIAVCPKKDIWETNVKIPQFGVSWTAQGDNLRSFNNWLIDLGINNSQQLLNAETLPRVQSLCKSFDINPAKFITILQSALSPNRAGFKLLSISEFASANINTYIRSGVREVWLDGPVVAVDKDIWINMYKSSYSKK